MFFNFSTAADICPTHVGMNRRIERIRLNALSHLPHARGDEPACKSRAHERRGICPTHVGMNRV